MENMDSKKNSLPTAEQIAAKRDVALGLLSTASAKGEAHVSPISAEQMDNLGTWAVIGTARFLFRAVPIRRAAALSGLIETHFPTVLVYAALGDEEGRGIDYGITATFWQAVNEETKAAKARNTPKETTTDEEIEDASAVAPDVASEVLSLTRRVVVEAESGSPSVGYNKRVVDALADALWMVADATPGLSREALPALIEESFTVPDLADLLRAIYLAVGGFPLDMADRFASP